MSDVAIRNAREMSDALAQQINSAQEQIAVWKAQKREIDDFISKWEMFAHHSISLDHHHRSTTNQGRHVNHSIHLHIGNVEIDGAGNSKKEEVSRAARRIIEMLGRPVSKPEMLMRLRDLGLRITGGDPEAVVNTMLYRTRDDPSMGIVYLKNHGYWTREVLNKEIGYNPAYARHYDMDS